MDPAAPATPEAAAPAAGDANLFSSAPAAAPASAATPPPAAAPAGLVLADGTFAPGWLESLDPELRANPALTTVPTLADLAKSYVHTKSMVGKKLQAPSETSTPEEISAWRKTVGAPDAPEGYGEIRPDDFPAEMWDNETAGQFKQIAHKHHLPAAAVKDIIALHAKSVQDGVGKLEAGETQHLETELATLKQTWGADFETQKNAAAQFATVLGLDPATNPLFRSADAVLAMARGAKLLMGDKIITGTSPGIGGGIEDRIRSVKASPEYLGERGEAAQVAAQSQLHSLMAARQKPAA